MLKYNMPDDPNIKDLWIKKALARNLNGLEINGESSLKKYITDINFDDIRTIDLIKDNIISTKDTRFLLLASEKSMFGFLIDIIKKEIEEMNTCSSNTKKINYVTYIGSPFKGDRMNSSYQTEMIVNIENSVAEGKIIILSDLDQIYSIFYDLFNQNYISKDGKKYCRISHGANIQKLAFVNENTKFIVLVDKKNLRKQKLPFLSRFEKYIVTFDALLDKEDKVKSKTINDICNKLVKVKDINYNMDNILVNTNEDIINGYVYLYKNKNKNSYKDIIKEKIIPILSQDIILTLPLSDLNNEKKEMELLKNEIYSNIKYNSLEEYLKSDKKGKEDILIVYTFSKMGKAINLTEKENYMEKITTEINSVYKFKQILNEFYEIKTYKSLILQFDTENSKYINYFISEIKNYKEIQKLNDNSKNFIFTISIQRDFDKIPNKVTTVLMSDEKINQLFIDNINGSALSIKDVEKLNINYFINEKILDPKVLIKEEMLNFYRKNKDYLLGVCSGIDSNNFITEFTKYIEKSNDIIKDIENIVLSQINDSEKLINLLIKDEKSINQDTIDLITAIITHIKIVFNEKIRTLLRKTESNNFFSTIFMLNINNKEEASTLSDSDNKLNQYSVKISDSDILNNKIISNIRKKFLKMIKEDKNEMTDDDIKFKINYKIPGLFNIYKEIKNYIEKEKLSFSYKHNENNLRKCEYELISKTRQKLNEDTKDFNEKLNTEVSSKLLITIAIESKTSEKNHLDFIELFLNDYITFYLVNLYNNAINDFVMNDIPHKIILLLLDLKFSRLKEEEKNKINLQNVLAKILWLEASSKYIKDILDLYNLISENIVYKENEKDYLFKQILYYLSKTEIKYEPKEPKLFEINEIYYKITIILFKCMIDQDSIKNAFSKKDNYYSYFKDLERCLKEIQKFDQTLKLDIKELSVLNEFITIYNIFEHAGKVNNLDISVLINNLTKSLEIIETNDEKKISSLCENLKRLIETIKETLYDSSKINEIKGDIVYYGLISNILLNELRRENNLEYKIFMLKEFLLTDEKLFIQSNQLLKIILEDFVSSNIDKFQGSLTNLSKPDLKILEDKINNLWIKETLLYIFEQISITYIQNRIEENDKEKKEENKKNIIYDLRTYFERCIELLEKLYNDSIGSQNKDEVSEIIKELEQAEKKDKEGIKSNINLKKLFSISFVRVYLKIFIDWINKDLLTNSNNIEEIIKIINGTDEKVNKEFRDMIITYVYKILYNMNQQDINKLFDEKIIQKFQLNKYSNFELLFKEKDLPQSFKNILFVDIYKPQDKKRKTNEEYDTYEKMFNKLNYCLKNSGDKENELIELINDNTLEIFYSVFSTKMSPYLSNPTISNDNQMKILTKIIRNKFDDKEKLLNIFELFLDKSKYKKKYINSKTAEILQFSLRFCLNADKINDDDNHIYYPLYSGNTKNSYIPGNDIKECKIYNDYSKIKKYLDNNPSSHGIYICTCNKYKEDEEFFIITEESNNGYPTNSGKCKFCGEEIGNDGNPKSFFERENYFRIFKNEEDLKEGTKDKGNGNCITLEKFYDDFISKKLEEDSKGVNKSQKSHFDNTDKPIRKQSQIGYRLMNLILYSHLFTNVLFNNKEELFTGGNLTYLDYIVGNWKKLENLLTKGGIDIYVFMNLIYKDLLAYLNKQKIIDSYTKLLEIEKEIENIIESKIYSKSKEAQYTKYEIYSAYYSKYKNKFRGKDSNYKTTLIKQINPVTDYEDEKKYPYYKSFLYSDYADKNFYREKLEEKDKGKYPVVDLCLNEEKNEENLGEDFACFNFVVKSLLNQYSGKITKDGAKKLTFEKTDVYKEYTKICNQFIDIINTKNRRNKLTKESSVENYFINSSTENGKILIQIYREYAENQNNLLNEIVQKINAINYDYFESQEINIQEAQKSDLLFLEFESKSDFNEIFLMNTFREIYNIYKGEHKIKYNSYNLYSVDFDMIEKILEETLIKHACILKADEIIEMRYSDEEFLNDGVSEFNKKIEKQIEDLNENDKKEFLKFYENNLEKNLVLCLEIEESLKNIIKYVNKNFSRINTNKSLYDTINEGNFTYKINETLKEFLKNNTSISIAKLSNFINYFENLYFELAMEKRNEYKEKIDESTKNKIDQYFREKSGLKIEKGTLSNTIIKFLINVIMNESAKKEVIDLNDNLFDYLNSKFLWKSEITTDSRFVTECEDFKNFCISIKNSYDFYSYISNDYKIKFEKEKNDIIEKIRMEENEKLKKEKEIKREEEEKNILENPDDDEEPDVDGDDIDNILGN